VLDLLEPTSHGSGDLSEVRSGAVADLTFGQRPDALLRVEVGCVRGAVEHREPLGVRYLTVAGCKNVT
jgi:hypothetical protein